MKFDNSSIINIKSNFSLKRRCKVPTLSLFVIFTILSIIMIIYHIDKNRYNIVIKKTIKSYVYWYFSSKYGLLDE